MAYVLPHMRKGNHARSPAADMLTPRFRRSLNFGSPGPKPVMDRSGKIVYADTAISGWFAVGLNDRELDFPNPVLRWVPQEQIKRMTGEKPLALVRGGSFSGIDFFVFYLVEDGQVSRCSAEKPWKYITEKILQNLIHSSEFVRKETEGEGLNLKEIRPKLVARVGKVLFLPRRPSTGEECLENDSVSEALLTQMKRNFYTNVPASYMEAIVDEVVPKIGVKFEDLKDVYHVKLSDKLRPEATISCKCRFMKEEARLELYKIELNHIRHMVYDISCIEKNLDLRLMLSTKRTLTSLCNDEVESIRNLIASAILDPSLKGGLRWPLRKATSLGDRYQVVGVWHTISRVYESPSLRLKVRDADRFDFKTSFGETTGEVTLKLKGVASELLGKELECDSVSDMLKDALKLLWENFLLSGPSVV